LYKYLRYFYESPSSLGNRKQASIALAPRSLVNLIICSVSERLSSIKLKAPLFIFGRLLAQPQKINGSFLLPKYSKRVLASCTTSVYVNLSKNSFFCASRGRFLVSGCKGTYFFRTNQDFLRKTFDFNATFLRLLMQIKDKMYIHLYNILYKDLL